MKLRPLSKLYVVLAALALSLASGPALADPWEAADSPEVERQALEAVGRLGPERGGIAVSVGSIQISPGISLDIIGFSTSTQKTGGAITGGKADVSGQVFDLNKSLVDLGAQVTRDEIRIALPGDILFAFDKWNIKPDAEATLTKLSAVIRAQPERMVYIHGHTDSMGTDTYNQTLSLKRAASVKAWLVKSGLPPARMMVEGFGKSRPVATNDTPEGRQQNRRVEVILKKR